jgi:hypothetical protein
MARMAKPHFIELPDFEPGICILIDCVKVTHLE